MKKYFIISISAFIIEICSTYYINVVANHDLFGMLFFASIGPFLGLPFIGYIVESENWNQRIKMAFSLSYGYCLGSLFSYYFAL